MRLAQGFCSAVEIVRQYLLGATARRTTYVHIIRGSVYRKCAAYDKTDSLAVRAPRRHSRLHAVTLTEPPWLKTGISCLNVHYINERAIVVKAVGSVVRRVDSTSHRTRVRPGPRERTSREMMAASQRGKNARETDMEISTTAKNIWQTGKILRFLADRNNRGSRENPIWKFGV